MAYITPTAEREELGGGVFRSTIHLAPVAYEDAGGNLRAISDRWGDGDATYPHVVSAARLRVRTAPNGDRLLLPVPGDDEAWFSISSPFINNGTNWIQPSLGSITRSGNQLTATAANVITRINHAGHYIKAEYELLNGWTPQNGRFAYRVGLNGLTRQGGTLLYNGVPVMQLRKPVAYDADNEQDVREIAHDFVQLGGNWYILFTLPSLAGMSRPVVDPTFESQPDGTAGEDTWINEDYPTSNNAANVHLQFKYNGTGRVRSLIRFDLSSIPAGATVTSASLALTTVQNGTQPTVYAHRISDANNAWTETGATWNNKDATVPSNWAGSVGLTTPGTDYVATAMGSTTLPSTGGVTGSISLDTTQVEAMIAANNGIVLIADETVTISISTARSSDYGTASHRPKLTVEYTVLNNYSLTMAAGSATFTGQAANLLAGRKLTAGAGSATFTGQAAGLRANRKLTAAAGSMTLTGYDAALNYSAAEIAVNADVYIRETASAIVEV